MVMIIIMYTLQERIQEAWRCITLISVLFRWAFEAYAFANST